MELREAHEWFRCFIAGGGFGGQQEGVYGASNQESKMLDGERMIGRNGGSGACPIQL